MVLMMTYSKYKNIKTKGCDSQKEARRLQQLLLLEKAGVITHLRQQVKYVLIPSQYETYERYSKKGKRLKDGQRCIEKECSYYADFVYTIAETGENIVEDTKGVRTEAYKIKRKLMLAVYSIRIKET
jgi:hypothetical protein